MPETAPPRVTAGTHCDRRFPAGEFRLAAGGLLILTAGALVYLLARPPGVLFLPDAWQLDWPAPPPLERLLGSAPSFMHPLAFGLLTAAVAGTVRRLRLATLAWSAINLVLEAAQLTAVRFDLRGVPLIGYGTFDPADCVAALFAPLAAWLLIVMISKRRG